MRSKTDRKICGTCEFWTGKREPVFTEEGIPKVEIRDKVGKCECPVSRFEESSRNCDSYCKKYSKWKELF